MLTVEQRDECVTVSVMGELMLDDFREFESVVVSELEEHERVDVLMDLSNMTGFSIDAAWEDLKFSREHDKDFRRIAVITSDQWISWLVWLNGAFSGAQVQTFPEREDAEHWLATAK
ncbi:MAG TPA: STAS/SEC14 domain-containing protein [Gammaproteobacteria bacterium]|nr:STAS/SEC14 domain-containing protein [Gammaproteobacteria bacterium]